MDVALSRARAGIRRRVDVGIHGFDVGPSGTEGIGQRRAALRPRRIAVEHGRAVDLRVRKAERMPKLMRGDALECGCLDILRIDRGTIENRPALRDDGRAFNGELRRGHAQHPVGRTDVVLQDAAVDIEDDIDAAAIGFADDQRHIGRIDIRQAFLREIPRHKGAHRGGRNARPITVTLAHQMRAHCIVEHHLLRRAGGIIRDDAEVAQVVVDGYGFGREVVAGAGVRIDDQRSVGVCRSRAPTPISAAAKQKLKVLELFIAHAPLLRSSGL